MEHSIELRINPFTFAQLSTIKEARISNGEKIVSFRNGAGKKKKRNGAGKAVHLHVKQ